MFETGCGLIGKARGLGPRDWEFKSLHSDSRRPTRGNLQQALGVRGEIPWHSGCSDRLKNEATFRAYSAEGI